MDEPLVSIITIFHNSERYIQQAIESVFAQTYSNWELLLVDDGSTDGSTVIARHYVEKSPKVRYLEHPARENRGKSASYNLALACAAGEYVGFLDSDDIFLSTKIASQVEILRSRRDVQMVYGRVMFWHSWTGKREDLTRDCLTILGVSVHTAHQPPSILVNLLENEDIHPPNCSYLVRRRSLMEVGCFSEEFRNMYEDTVLLSKIFLTASAYVTPDCVALYRQHPLSSCHIASLTGQFHETEPNPARRAFLEWLDEYLSHCQSVSRDLRRALDRELWPYRHPRYYALIGSRRKRRQIARQMLITLLPSRVLTLLKALKKSEA